jgi:glycosyltransferase involved in cell wall biosynthesis
VKLACVIQRYGAELAGGSEAHCRALAERLASHHDVTVLTSCAEDHLTWQNSYSAGDSYVGPVRVRRFLVARNRQPQRLTELSELVFRDRASTTEEEAWFHENGPQVPGLIDDLRQHGREYDLVLFWSYRYYQSFFGLPVVGDRAVLVPTAEEDPMIRMRLLGRFFLLPRGYVFLTPEEGDLVAAAADGPLPPSLILGAGLDPAAVELANAVLEPLELADPFVLYLGRVDRNKGCEMLLRCFMQYLDDGRAPATLVLAGPSSMPVPNHPRIRALGYVAPSVRNALLAQARALVIPSRFESLSLALLEGWNFARPALVNGRCHVLRGQVRRANAGLYFDRYDDFAESLEYLLTRPDEAGRLGRQGLAYVEQHYRWPVVMERFEGFLERLSS